MTECIKDGFNASISSREETNQSECDDSEIFYKGPSRRHRPESDEFQDWWKDESQKGAAESAHERDEQIQFWDQRRQSNYYRKNPVIIYLNLKNIN